MGSRLPECILVRVGTFSCVKIDERKARESVKYQNWMQIDEHKKAEEWK